MLERRKRKRSNLIYCLAVFDRNTDRLIGYLADITRESAMVICEEPHDTDKVYQLKFESSASKDDCKQIDVDAMCIRCMKNDIPGFYNCGFKFLKINPESIEDINEMAIKFEVDKYNINNNKC